MTQYAIAPRTSARGGTTICALVLKEDDENEPGGIKKVKKHSHCWVVAVGDPGVKSVCGKAMSISNVERRNNTYVYIRRFRVPGSANPCFELSERMSVLLLYERFRLAIRQTKHCSVLVCWVPE